MKNVAVRFVTHCVELVRKRSKRKKGFTLMEIMVVVLILGLIAGYAVPRYLSGIRTAKLGQVIGNYETVRTEVWAAYYVPGSDEESAAKVVGLNNYNKLSNPFGTLSETCQAVVVYGEATPKYYYYDGGSWELYNTAGTALTGGEVVLDYSTSGEITVTAYDDTATAGGMQTDTIDDPKS